jgi:hypothetical protein
MRTRPLALSAAAGLAFAAPVLAQTRLLIVDRTTGANKVWAVDDLNSSGTIEEASELFTYWTSANGAGTPAMQTPAAIAVRKSDGLVAVTDSNAAVRGVFLLHDLNHNNAAQEYRESILGADLSNASGVQLNAPLGAAFDGAGTLYIANSGATGTQDAIYRLTDLDNDGRFQSAGEITEFVGQPFYGVGNTAYVPAQIAIDASQTPFVGYVKDSSATFAGVYRFSDTNGNGRADDAGEMTLFVSGANGSGVPVASGGLLLALDTARPNAVYFNQTVSAVRQLVRAQDLNGNHTAQDAGEAAIVWSTTEALTITDLTVLPSGDVVLMDFGNKRLILLHDANGDGLFDNATERTTFYAAALPASPRFLAQITRYCQANCDESTQAPILNVADFSCFLTKYAAGDLYANCDGSTQAPILNVADFSCFLSSYAAGCP